MAILLVSIALSLLIWTVFITQLLRSFTKSPKLQSVSAAKEDPKVNIILPVRNDEGHIGKCLDGLLKQSYPNYDVFVICDSDNDKYDKTVEIVSKYNVQHPEKIHMIMADPKPDDWVGKNWACYSGYLKSDGDILLFTDSDTLHSEDLMTSAIGYFLENKLDVLTIRPRLLCEDLWSKIIYPVLWTYHHIKYSAILVNNPNKRNGSVFGCFFIIKRKSYEKLGTHKEIKGEILEDITLGEKIKKAKIALMLIHGEYHLQQSLSGNFKTAWQRLSRSNNVFPIPADNIKYGIFISIISIFLSLLLPFILLPVLIIINQIKNLSNIAIDVLLVLFFIDLMVITLLGIVYVLQSRWGLLQNPLYALVSPIGAMIVAVGFMYPFFVKRENIQWRGRSYVVNRNNFRIGAG
jgi:glycosyltransferase involved in cell wall biosynthesis